MRNLIRFTAIFGLLFLVSCNSKNKVKLIGTNAADEVPTLGNLTFSFDKNLVGDTLLNTWDSTHYITFEPAIEGRFRWENANELIFSPDHDLDAATDYKAIITDKIVSHCSYKLGSIPDIKFHTPYQRLEASNTLWTVLDESTQAAAAQVELFFLYKVNPTKLKEKLSIEVDGTKHDFNILTAVADNHIAVNILGVKLEDKNYNITVKIDKGLLPEGGTNATKEAIEAKMILPSPFVLNISDVKAEHDGTAGTVHILSSQQIVAESLTNLIKFDPPVSFKTEVSQDGLVLTSDKFDVTKNYTVTLKSGIKGRIGGVLKEEYSHQVVFGQLEPSIKFANNKGIYLTGKGAKNIEVQIINVPKIKVTISKIYESNLLAANRYGFDDYGYNDYQESEEGERTYNSDLQLGDVVYEKEIETASLPKYNNSRLFKFDFADKLPEFKGIYRLSIRSSTQYYLRESRFVSLSDIGLIAKDGSDKMLVFANSIKTAEKLSGVTISVYGSNNQVMGTGVTDGDGIAEIAMKRKEFSGFRPAMIVAKLGSDFNYMPLASTQVETSRFEVGGKRANSTGLDAFVYSERDMYRPGEKINFSVIVRDQKWKTSGEIPVKLKFLLPNGQELKSFKKTLNEEGSLETAIELSPAAVTGSYSLEIYTSNDILLTTKNVLIEEFMPDRIKVTTVLDKPFLKVNENTKLSINAVNFFGPPAANRNYEVEIQVKQKYFSPKKFNSFNFSLANQNASYDKITKEGVTDENGNASETFTIPASYSNSGILQTDFYTTVFDESGRPVNRKSTVDIFTQEVFYGLGFDGYYYCPVNQAVRFPIVALNKDEKAVTTQAHVQVIKHEYKTILSRAGEYLRYESQQEDKTITDQTIAVSGENTAYSFVPHTSGDYEIRISKPGVNSYVSQTFYSYGWGYNSNSSFEVNNEGSIDIELDKEKYTAGESAKVLFKTPFNGKILVTLESDKVIDHFYLQTDKRSASTSITLKADYLPNAFITATLIKPHEETDLPLTVAHGYKSISVEEKSRKQKVEIIAAKSVRARTHQKVTVKASPNSKITLAAVDEGVLQITGFKTPDPYAFFYQNRALQVNSFDLYPLLFPEINNKISSTGGDGFDLTKRVNPIQNKRVKLLTYWSGITTANGNGEANFEFDIPQFSGEVRLMAVAYKDNSFGSNEAHMTVADPIVVVTSLPRFVSPKDTIDVPVTISNTTNSNTTASATARTEGPLKIVGDNTQSVKVNAKSEGKVWFKIVADPRADAAKVIVDVSGAGEKFSDVTEIAVRPPASLQKINGSGTVNGGSTATIDISANGKFMSSSLDYKLVVSRSPMIEFSNHLTYLLQYPYGCTEQTISAAFPQLYFQDLSGITNSSIGKNANYNVQEAIRKIKMRQLYNGGLTLWDGEGTENWWATVYAAHFLIEAKKAGFEVDEDLQDKLYSYLNAKLRNKETINYYYNRNQNRKIAPREVAYSLYVLALAGKPQVSTMNYYKANTNLLTLDSRYLLSAAFALSGDKGKFRELLPSSFSGEVSDNETGGSFGSAMRDEAIALNTLVEVDPQNTQIPIMAKHVADNLKKDYYWNTQERVFSFLALGKIMRQNANATVTAQLKVNGKVVGEMKGNTIKLNTKQLTGSRVELSTQGSGKLYYFYETEGITADGSYKQEDSYLKVRKTFYDRYGHVLSGNIFKQNDLIIVGITLENTYSKAIDNIVITDMLPAGFEIENPRTKEIPAMDWIKNDNTPTASDFRDDRVNLFVNLYYGGTQRYYYAVRAVSPGTFIMGPVMADAMYAGEYHSYHGGGVVRVMGK